MKWLVLLLPLLLNAQTTGKVIRIADGDTLTILTAENTQVKVRLHGIGALERKQPFGTVSQKDLI